MARHLAYVAALIGAALLLPVATPASAWSGSTVCDDVESGEHFNFRRS